MMLAHFLDDEHIDDVLRLLTTKYHRGYYYKMGAAWTLSYCYIKYPEKTEPMLFKDTLDKEIRNKTVQKISDSFRVSKEDKERLKAKKKSL
jgi:3-methyladenine DNA glycosylase AlkD